MKTRQLGAKGERQVSTRSGQSEAHAWRKPHVAFAGGSRLESDSVRLDSPTSQIRPFHMSVSRR